MTPKTSDNPEAIRNRNIAAVSTPRNWLKTKEGSISLGAGKSLSRIAGEGGEPSETGSGQCRSNTPPRSVSRGAGDGGVAAERASLQQRLRVEGFRLRHDREGRLRVL